MALSLEEALTVLLGDDRTGDDLADLVAAARESFRRREINTQAGAAVLHSLVTDQFRSYEQIADLTGIPQDVAQKWAAPPERQPVSVPASRMLANA